MTDLISRADAIEAVKETKPIVRSTERNWGKMIAEQHSKELVKALKSLPSADAVHGWIPIKDGLPKAYKDVMATVWFEDYGDDDDAFEIAFGYLNKFWKWDLRLADGSECIKGFYVQAWMPLPTTYKGGDE